MDESNVNRLEKWFSEYECAIISAYRTRIENDTGNTWIQKDKDGNDVGRNVNLTYRENQERHERLKHALLGMGYGITQQRGMFRENGKEKSSEKSFVVVNLSGDENFKSNLANLSEYFNQDSFIYKPKGTLNAVYVGTNNSSYPPFSPGYGMEEPCGKFTKKVGLDFYSKIRGNEYVFESSSDHRKAWESIVCDESFSGSSYQKKQWIAKKYNEFLSEQVACNVFRKLKTVNESTDLSPFDRKCFSEHMGVITVAASNSVGEWKIEVAGAPSFFKRLEENTTNLIEYLENISGISSSDMKVDKDYFDFSSQKHVVSVVIDVGKSVHDDLLFEMDDDEEGYDEEMEKRKSEKIASITKFLSSAGFSDFTNDEKSMQEVCY